MGFGGWRIGGCEALVLLIAGTNVPREPARFRNGVREILSEIASEATV